MEVEEGWRREADGRSKEGGVSVAQEQSKDDDRSSARAREREREGVCVWRLCADGRCVASHSPAPAEGAKARQSAASDCAMWLNFLGVAFSATSATVTSSTAILSHARGGDADGGRRGDAG
jgi:hypothetical protein